MIAPELLKDMEEYINKIKKNLEIAHDKENSYANKGRTFKQFKIVEHVFLKVKEKKNSSELEA